MKSPPLRPFQITRRKLDEIFSSPTLVDQMIRAGWIIRVREGGRGREAFYDFSSAETAYERWRAGEEPERVSSDEPTP
jgi:hypothetical protein